MGNRIARKWHTSRTPKSANRNFTRQLYEPVKSASYATGSAATRPSRGYRSVISSLNGTENASVAVHHFTSRTLRSKGRREAPTRCAKHIQLQRKLCEHAQPSAHIKAIHVNRLLGSSPHAVKSRSSTHRPCVCRSSSHVSPRFRAKATI